MKQNLYYQTMYARRNMIKDFILGIFFKLSSYPRLLLEVFIRKNFGERYFNLASVITAAVVFAYLPWFVHVTSLFWRGNLGHTGGFWPKYASWYIFLLAFLYFSYRRWQEVKRNPSAYDFAKFTLYSGDIDSRFRNLKISRNEASTRTIEILYEPVLFFILGILLLLLGQGAGTMLIICSIFYSLSYAAAYKQGDDFIMDIIDQIILNEEMESAFINDEGAEETRGVRFYLHKPNGEDLRRATSSWITADDLDDFAVAK